MDIELDELLAEHIMEWEPAYRNNRAPEECLGTPVYNRFFNSGPVEWGGLNVKRDEDEPFTPWSPTSNDADALEAAAVFLSTNRHYKMCIWYEEITPRTVRHGWRCTFLERQGDIYKHGAPSIALAISRALEGFATGKITFHPSLDITIPDTP